MPLIVLHNNGFYLLHMFLSVTHGFYLLHCSEWWESCFYLLHMVFICYTVLSDESFIFCVCAMYYFIMLCNQILVVTIVFHNNGFYCLE